MSSFSGITMSECTVQLWYNKQRIKIDGNASLYLQIIVGGEHSEVKLKNLQWPANKIDWTKKNLLQRYKGDEEVLIYNAMIERERAKYWNVVMNFLKQERSFKLSDIFKEINLYKNGHLFCAFMKQAIKDRQKTTIKKDMIKASTAAGHMVTLGWFEAFLSGTDIEIHKIDDVILERFANYVGENMIQSSVWNKIKDIKTYLSYAFRHKIMVNPHYKIFTIPKPEHDPTWLEHGELDALLQLYYGSNPEKPKLSAEQMRNCRAFLFACFTGLRISDLSRWNKDWLRGDHISFIPQKIKKSNKNPKPVIIPIIPVARQFIDDLPVETFDLPEDQVYNRGLKVLAELAGIDKNLTSHVARHTFATWLAIDNVPLLVISKLLGHKSTVTTQIYIHIAQAHMAHEMMKMQKRFELRPNANIPLNPYR